MLYVKMEMHLSFEILWANKLGLGRKNKKATKFKTGNIKES